MKTFTKKIIIILLFFILLFNIFNISYCFFDSTPKIVTKLNDAFTKIEEWLLHRLPLLPLEQVYL